MATKNNLEKHYPSILHAYDIAIKSYDWCINRSNSIDDTIDKLLTWITSVTIAIPTFVYAQHLKNTFNSKWFTIAIILFVGAIVSGVTTNLFGSLKLISPSDLFNRHLHKNEYEFKKDITYWAGKSFIHNQQLVNWKGYISILMIVCFSIEIISLWLWITVP